MEQLPTDLQNIIMDYKYQLEVSEKYQKVINEINRFDYIIIKKPLNNLIYSIRSGNFKDYYCFLHGKILDFVNCDLFEYK